MGYYQAGFQVVGVDVHPQPHYPFEFHRLDWREGLARLAACAACVHASPPCQAYSTVSRRSRRGERRVYPDVLREVRAALVAADLPYVIENVTGAPLVYPILLCGSSFGLDVRRHRYFESSVCFFVPPCRHGSQLPRFRSMYSRQTTPAAVVGVHGHLNFPGELALRQRAMGIDWMSNAEITQAIPPAYTHFLGLQIRRTLEARTG